MKQGLRIGIFLFFLVIIGLLASFYTPAVIVRVKTYLYRGSSSPYNTEWSGTSILLSVLREKGVEVVITENDREFINELSRGGLLLVIAPDYSFEKENIEIIHKLLSNGTINLAVFDENTTMNNVIREYGVEVIGKAILDPLNPYEPGYPRSVVYGLHNEAVLYRLNWGSPLNISDKGYNVSVISIAFGVLDLNDNGMIDELKLGPYVIGVIINTSVSGILVFGDSYPLLNDAFIRNISATNIFIDYLIWLASMSKNRIIIPNQLYRINTVVLKTPFHISLLFLILAQYLKNIDYFLDNIFIKYRYIELTVLFASFLALLALLKYLSGVRNVIDYNLSPVKRYRFLIGSIITRSVIDKNILGGKEKDLITRYWNILSIVYKNIKNIDFSKLFAEEKYDVLSRYGFSKKDLGDLKWLYKVYVKIREKKFLPLIIRWRPTLFKYVVLVEKYLNMLGYTIMNKSGYRDVSTIIK